MFLRTTHSLKLLLAGVVCFNFLFVAQIRAADFSGIGYLTPDDNISTADALSSDGASIVGTSARGFVFEFPSSAGFRYYQTYHRAYLRDSAGMRPLAPPPYTSYFGEDLIRDVAPFGSAVLVAPGSRTESFGDRSFGIDQLRQESVWTPSSGFTPVAELVYPTSFGGSASIYAGRWEHDQQSTAFRHTSAGIEAVGPQAGEAVGISANGQVVVGNVTTGFTFGWTRPPTDAFRWTPAGGTVSLGENTYATGVSGDGRVVIGENFVWTEAGGKQSVSPLAPWQVADLEATTFDGSIAVGNSRVVIQQHPILIRYEERPINLVSSTAIIWDSVNGTRDLKTVLETQYGLDLTGWFLTGATDISDSGRTIIGNGVNPQGQTEGWIVHLDPMAVPEPAAWALAVLGACAMPILRRKGRV